MLQTTQAIDPRSGIAMRYPVDALMPSRPGSIDDVLEALVSRSAIIRTGRDEEIVAQEDDATHCYLIISGCVRTVRLMEDGRRQVGEFLFAGDLIGWEALDQYDFGAEAVTTAILRRYARRDLDRLADQDRDVARLLHTVSSRRLRQGREHMVLLGRKTAGERIASFLLQMADRDPDRLSRIELPMSRLDMGDFLGLTIETVCRRLTRLRAEGTIEVEGSKITIRDRRALLEAGCEPVVH